MVSSGTYCTDTERSRFSLLSDPGSFSCHRKLTRSVHVDMIGVFFFFLSTWNNSQSETSLWDIKLSTGTESNLIHFHVRILQVFCFLWGFFFCRNHLSVQSRTALTLLIWARDGVREEIRNEHHLFFFFLFHVVLLWFLAIS